MQVPSLVVHFSASIYEEIMGLMSQFSMLLLPDSSGSLKLKSNGLKAYENTWFSIDASLDAVNLLVNLEDDVAGGCTLSLYCQKLGVWYVTLVPYLFNDIEVSYGLAYYSTRDCVCGALFSSSPHMHVDFIFHLL